MSILGSMELIGVETSLKTIEEDIAEESHDRFYVQMPADRLHMLCSALIKYAEKYEGYERHSPEVLTAMCFMSNNDEEVH